MVGDILQPTHLLFILVIALVVLGPKRLPEVGKSLGKGLRDFRGALRDNDPREDLAELNQHAMTPIQTAPPAPEPVATAAPSSRGPASEQHESD